MIFALLISLLMVFATSDDDQDGVSNANDNCAGTTTTIVDTAGCSCAQKTCPSGYTCVNEGFSAVCSLSTDRYINEVFSSNATNSNGTIDCFADSSPGNGPAASYFNLGDTLIYQTAIQALQEYNGGNSNTADEYMEAVASYLHNHMEYLADPADNDNAQSAKWTIESSGNRGCGKDYCGDCEDHSILRTALLRSLGINWRCVFTVTSYQYATD